MTEQDVELNLLIMYINGWEEDSRREPGGKAFRVWIGYPFDILNELERLGLIRQFAKSVIITSEGISRAKALKQQYLNPKALC